MKEALRALYNTACHHPRCERGPEGTHTCSCGVSAALEQARVALGLRDYTQPEPVADLSVNQDGKLNTR